MFSLDFLATEDFFEPNIAAGKGSEALRFMLNTKPQCFWIWPEFPGEAQQNEFGSH